MNQDLYKKLIGGQSKGPIAVLLRFLLNVAAVFYGACVALRNLFYDKGLAKSYAVTAAGLKTTDRTQASVPVISVGNITVGGTGKTPMVIWLCNWLGSKGINCAILTRGYKAIEGNQIDEPALLIRNCPQATLIVNPDRLAGTLEAVKRHHSQVLIMDDGFQHRRLHRDIDIVTIDSSLPFGYGRLLPAGLLREPCSSLKRAQAAVLTRCDLVSEDNLTKLTEVIRGINPEMVIAKTIHNPVCAVASGDGQITLEQLRHKKVFVFCGIANPDAFFATLDRLKTSIVGSRIYNDHHNYTAADTNEIFSKAAQSGAEMILTTEKDYNKIDTTFVGKTTLILAYLSVRLLFIEGEEDIRQLIETAFAGKIPKKRTV